MDQAPFAGAALFSTILLCFWGKSHVIRLSLLRLKPDVCAGPGPLLSALRSTPHPTTLLSVGVDVQGRRGLRRPVLSAVGQGEVVKQDRGNEQQWRKYWAGLERGPPLQTLSGTLQLLTIVYEWADITGTLM